ncbi:ABC transporter permease [Photobacterium leiognathi]|uniref:ABC transporter permease n=1 Tax=Photobacterium leiognathi TaxID=553611 RepID=UPI0029829FE9|nr:ABC transporter permease [Photobacterium leiognathi]
MATVKKRSIINIWGDVIFAIFLREIKSRSNDKLGIAWTVISPVAFIFMLSYVRGIIDGGETHSIPTFYFMVFGMILVQFFLGLVGSISAAIKKNKPLYAFRQVQPISSVIAIAGFEFLIKFFVIIIIGILAFYLQYDVTIADPIFIFLNLTQVWLIATSIGVIFALASCYIPEIDKLRSLAMRPIFFISGIFFSLQDIPEEFWPYLTWNPLLHAVELTRYAAYPQYGSAGVSEFFLNTVTLGCVFFAFACYHISWKQAISR